MNMPKSCPICKKELDKFDDLVWRCRKDKTHDYSCLVYENKIEFELIKLSTSPVTLYGLEINYSQKSTQITKIDIKATVESTFPFYHENGIMEFDFSDIPALIKRIELLETFS